MESSRQSPSGRATFPRVALVMSALLTALASVVAVSDSAMAQQAAWIKTAGACASQATFISFNRQNGNCNTNRAFGADANLRTPGQDTFLDSFFVGSLPGAAPNTHSIFNRWTITVRICQLANFVGLRHTIPPNGLVNTNVNALGLRSYRGNACI